MPIGLTLTGLNPAALGIGVSVALPLAPVGVDAPVVTPPLRYEVGALLDSDRAAYSGALRSAPLSIAVPPEQHRFPDIEFGNWLADAGDGANLAANLADVAWPASATPSASALPGGAIAAPGSASRDLALFVGSLWGDGCGDPGQSAFPLPDFCGASGHRTAELLLSTIEADAFSAALAGTLAAEATGTDQIGDGEPPQAAGQEQPDPQPGPPQSRPAAQTATLSLPVLLDSRQFQPVIATITQERVVDIDAGDIARTFADVLNDQALQSIVALGDGMVPVQELAALGVIIRLNSATLALEATVDPALLRGRVLQASRAITFSGVERVVPQEYAIGLTAALIASSSLDSDFDPDAEIDFSGFVNIGGVRGINIDFGGDIELSNSSGSQFFQRDRVVAFKDWPDQAFRLSAGDVIPNQARLAGTFDVLGLTFERNYEAIQPTRNIRPLASRALRLDRRSAVEVYVNNVLVERFIAEPGPIDITRIPGASFSNNVTIVVEDSLGRREVENFTFGSDINLLAEGLDQFSFSVGLLRDPFTGGFSYSDDPVASAFYERGLSAALTLGGHAAIAEQTQNAGVAAAIGVPIGTITADAAFSHDKTIGSGFAAGATFRGSPFAGSERGEFATVTFDYRSRNFTSLDQFGFLNNVKFNLSAEYQVNVSERSAVFGSASYLERYGISGGDVFASAGVRHNFGRLYGTLAARYTDRAGGDTDFGVLATVTIPLGRRNTVTATYDSASDRGRAEFRRQRGLTLPEVDYRFGVAHTPIDDSLFGSFGYANTRFDAEADVSQRFARDGGTDETFGTVRFQTGFGLTDGQFALGRDPGQGFAIVSRHPSIEDATLTVRTSAAGRELGYANKFGPALVEINSPYRPQEVTIDAANIPIGYDIGAGRYLLESGARSGLHIVVGNDAYRTAIATLSVEGEAVTLAYGQFRRADDPDAPSETFFTNRQGRAAFSNLAPGEYVIEIPSLDLRGRFTVGEDDPALIRLDSLELERQ